VLSETGMPLKTKEFTGQTKTN